MTQIHINWESYLLVFLHFKKINYKSKWKNITTILGAKLCIQIDRYQHIGGTCTLLQVARGLLIPICQSTQCHFSKHNTLNIHRCDNLKYWYKRVAINCNFFWSEVISGWVFLNLGREYVFLLATTDVDRPWGVLSIHPQADFFPIEKN